MKNKEIAERKALLLHLAGVMWYNNGRKTSFRIVAVASPRRVPFSRFVGVCYKAACFISLTPA